jgi:hypothetical protein
MLNVTFVWSRGAVVGLVLQRQVLNECVPSLLEYTRSDAINMPVR